MKNWTRRHKEVGNFGKIFEIFQNSKNQLGSFFYFFFQFFGFLFLFHRGENLAKQKPKIFEIFQPVDMI